MKRLVGMSAALLLLAIQARPAVAQQVMLQPMVGASFSTVSNIPLDTGEDTKTRVGFVGGLGIGFALSPQLSIGTGGYYAQQGVKLTASGSDDVTLKLDYIQVPLTLSVGFPTGGSLRPALFAGPMLGFKASCKLSDGSQSVNCDDPGVDAQVKSTDFSLLFGGALGIQAGTGRLSLVAWYDLGLTKIDDSATPSDAKNRVFGFGLSYAFPLGGGM